MQYMIAIRRKVNEDANDWFNFGGHDDPITESILDPVKNITIKFNNNDRVRKNPAKFFRLVVPYVHHTNLPREFIYVWSYAIEPEDPQPTGFANHSRIDNVELNLELDQRIFLGGSSSATILNYARAKNTLRVRHGLLTKKFSS